MTKKESDEPKRQLKPILVISVVFVCFVTIVFLAQKKDSIDWIEDYNAGIELAKKQNKPVLLAFYKRSTRFSTDMWNNTYNNPEVKSHVETNFVPVLIDVDKQPKIAEQYKVSYYPSHFVKDPNTDRIVGPRLGYDPPALFITELEILQKKLNSAKD